MSFGQRNLDREKPEIDFPEGDVPTELVITDLIEGDGAEAKAGDTVSTHYVGVAWSTGEEFDASWGRGAPLDFRVGVGQVIQGWDQGLLGMKVGGRRRLEIPSELAYGSRGAGGAIGPNEALIFVVDLVAVRYPHPPPILASSDREPGGVGPPAGGTSRLNMLLTCRSAVTIGKVLPAVAALSSFSGTGFSTLAGCPPHVQNAS